MTCHCEICDEPDPHCEHGVNLAEADCLDCALKHIPYDLFERHVALVCQTRQKQAERGEACPKCWHVYPAPITGVSRVTCGMCGFVNRFGEGSVCHECDGTGVTY